MYDVVVVGAGPAGSVAAKNCAERGLRTLVLERHKLPRDKICSGMIMGPLAHKLIREQFGEIPEWVLTEPAHLSGYKFHVPGVGIEKVEHFTCLSWRRDLDYWMNQKAMSCGSEIWPHAKVAGVRVTERGFSLSIEKGIKRRQIEARFVVGADGANSTVRKALFPDFKVRYSQVWQEHLLGEVDLEKNYMHWFYPIDLSPSSLSIHQKDGVIVMDVVHGLGKAMALLSWGKDFLAKDHRLNAKQDPVWKGSCLEPALYRELTSYAFKPAKGNALLVGDAAGLIMPISGEGIGLALKSGICAVNAIVAAIARGKEAEPFYLEEISCIISFFREIYPLFRKITDEAKRGGSALPAILRDAYQSTLRSF